ncbi:MAG: BREX system serine/threonine kinase PglW [Planctomycetes bacterium]|nr:BREX system serine/threonine kinase PglW [Planctomycetota bacterium]
MPTISSERWKVITESSFPHEREALEFARSLLPDHEPYRAWVNFEFHANDGSLNEIDLLVMTPKGAFVVEIKGWPGELRGDWGSWVWTHEGISRTVENPLTLLNRKCKRLKSFLERHWAGAKCDVPFLQPLVFLSDSKLRIRLDPTATTHVAARVPANGAQGLREAIIEIAPDQYQRLVLERRRLDKVHAKAMAQALEKGGIRRTKRRVGDYEIGKLLFDGPGFQDFAASHATIDGVQKRIRLYSVAQSADAEVRGTIQRAAEREFRLLQGIEYPGILRAETYTDTPTGPALIFEHFPDAERLDRHVQDLGGRFDIERRLDYLRQIAEAVRYAHGKRLVHRALGPQSILVRNPSAAKPLLVLFNWQTSARASGTTTGPDQVLTATAHVDRLIDDEGALYMAPELASNPEAFGEDLDVFSLGAIAWFLFTGQKPAATFHELIQRVQAGPGLQLAGALDGAPAALCELVRFATYPERATRTDSVDSFLEQLDAVEEELTRPTSRGYTNPAEAAAGDVLPGGWNVVKRLGKGSTAVAYLARRNDDEYVLKVALDPEHNDRVRREGEVLHGLHHQGIVRLREIVELGTHVALALDRAGTETVATRLREDGQLTLDLLERYGDDLLEALAYLESEGIWHRDIKPDNLGIAPRGKNRELHAVLFDFSLARAPAEQIHAGTRPYLDPFLSHRPTKRYDAHAERFAAAVTLYEMTLGTHPRWGNDENPAVLTCEVTIEADHFPVEHKKELAAFFAKALARDPNQRFESARAMRNAWSSIFRTAERPPTASPGASPQATRPPSTPSGAAIGTGTETGSTDAAAADEALRAARATAKPTTSIVSLGLSTRAANALDRVGVATVAQFVALPQAQLWQMRGVGQKTRKELLDAQRELKAIVPATVSPPRVGRRSSVESIVSELLPPKSASATPKSRILRAILGLEPLATAEHPYWLSQREAAQLAGTQPANVNAALATARSGWEKDQALAEIRTDLVGLVETEGGVATPIELADALLAAHGSALLQPEERRRSAIALVRAALEVESGLIDRRLLVRRPGDLVFIARDGAGYDGQSLVDAVEKLGAVADELAADDPLPSPSEVQARLRDVWWPDGMTRPAPERLARLAVAAAKSAALSARLEIYPKNLAPERALRLAHGTLLGASELTKSDLEARVRARYPECAPLPERPALDALLKDAGLPHVFDPKRRDGAGAFTVPDSASTLLTSDTRSTPRAATALDRPAEISDEVAAARAFEERLARAQKDGVFLVLAITPSHALDAERELLRRGFALERRSVDVLLLDAMRRHATANEVPWSVVLNADRARPDSVDGKNLRRLVRMAIADVEQQLATSTRTILLTQPGLLARFDCIDVLERLRDRVGARVANGGPTLFGVWVLVPCDDQREPPVLNGVAVPVITRAQWARIPISWVKNRHRGSAAAQGEHDARHSADDRSRMESR